MDALSQTLRVPAAGSVAAVSLGRWQVLVQRAGDRVTAVAHDGRRAHATEWPAATVELWATLVLPALPVQVQLAEPQEVPPGEIARTELRLPWCLELAARDGTGRAGAPQTLLPSGLKMAWLADRDSGAVGRYVHVLRAGGRGTPALDAGVRVPVQLENEGATPVRVDRFELAPSSPPGPGGALPTVRITLAPAGGRAALRRVGGGEAG